MQGVLIGCLRKQFASITGGRAHFSMDCQQEVLLFDRLTIICHKTSDDQVDN